MASIIQGQSPNLATYCDICKVFHNKIERCKYQPRPQPCIIVCNCGGPLMRFLLHMTLFFYGFCFFIQHATSRAISYMIGTDKVLCEWIEIAAKCCMILLSPLYGRFGDLYCPCKALKLSYGAVALSYMLLLTYVPLLYYVSRFLESFFLADLGTRMVMAHFTCRPHRTSALAFIGIIFTLGTFCGSYSAPMIMAKFGGWHTILGTWIIMAVCFMLTFFYLQCGMHDQKIDCCFSDLFNLTEMWYVLVYIAVSVFLTIKVMISVPLMAIRLMLPGIWIDHYAFPDDMFLNQFWLLHLMDLCFHIVSYIIICLFKSDIIMMQFSFGIIAASSIGIVVTENYSTFIMLCAALLCAGIALDVTIMSVMSKGVPQQHTGLALGLHSMVHIGIQVLMPLVLATIKAVHEQSLSYVRLAAECSLVTSIVSFLIAWFVAQIY